MANMINVDGSDDPSYRYKMPRLVSKVEGRGNGVKTVLVNCADVAQSLHRSTAQVTKFFGCELGAMTNYEEKIERSLVNGAFENKVLQEALTDYIEKFVLCPSCRNPETVQEMKGKKKSAIILLNCKACGATNEADNAHKLVTFIIKEMSGDNSSANKKELRKLKRIEKSKKKNDDESKSMDESVSDGEKKKKKKHKKKKEKEGDDDGKDKEKKKKKKHKSKSKSIRSKEESDEGKVGSEESADNEDVDDVAEDLGAMTVNDVEILNSAVSKVSELIAGGTADPTFILSALEEAQVNGGLRRADKVPILFFSLVNNKVSLTALMKNFALLNNTVQSVKDCFLSPMDVEIELLLCLEESVGRIEDGPSKDAMLKMVPVILKLLFDEELVDEKVILDWYAGKLDATKYKHLRHIVAKDDLERIRISATPIIEWLKDAETDSDSDEEEDEEDEDDE